MRAHTGSPVTAFRPSAPLWPLGLVLIGLVLFLVAPGTELLFPTNVFALVIFGSTLYVLPGIRPTSDRAIAPVSWALFLFGVTMVVCPLLISFLGVSQSVLPHLPDLAALHRALSVTIVAFVAFCVSCSLALRGFHNRRARGVGWFTESLPRWLTTTFVVLGVAGLVLSFGGLGSVLSYLTSPEKARLARLDDPTLAGAAGLVLRPFLGFGFVAIWCRSIDTSTQPYRLARSKLLLVMAGTLLAYGTFGFNRASFVYPLVALVGVYSRYIRRIRAAHLLGLATIGLVLILTIGVYRSRDTTLGEFTGTLDSTPITHDFDLDSEVQAYGAAPQFLAFAMTEADLIPPRWGRAVLSGIASPVPVLGQPFRSSAGTGLYNSWIYGTAGIRDQVLPFAGEMYIDFRVPGVVLGFVVLGLVIARLQFAFDRATSAIGVFVTTYVGIWLAFPIIGSAEVVSQTLIYSMWPVYTAIVYAIIRGWDAPHPSALGHQSVVDG